MLVDTNVVSELMRRDPDAAVVAWVSRQRRLRLSVVTVEEVVYGLESRRSPRLGRWFEDFVARHCEVLDVTAAIARRCGHLRASARGRGSPRTQADMLIAATALEHDLSLATRNTRDFEGCGLSLVNPW